MTHRRDIHTTLRACLDEERLDLDFVTLMFGQVERFDADEMESVFPELLDGVCNGLFIGSQRGDLRYYRIRGVRPPSSAKQPTVWTAPTGS